MQIIVIWIIMNILSNADIFQAPLSPEIVKTVYHPVCPFTF